jgi:hypothetical protein
MGSIGQRGRKVNKYSNGGNGERGTGVDFELLALALENRGLVGEESSPFAEAARGPAEGEG